MINSPFMDMKKSPIPSSTSSCPYCHTPLGVETQYCDNCGVDLALATYLAENAVIAANITTGMLVSPEILVPRLGEYLFSKGLLNKEQLDQALDYQKDQAELGRQVLVGQALLELDLIPKEPIDQAITEQILELQAALRQANRRLEARVQERTAELEHTLTKLAELNQLKSNFISNISHELRTPLTHIKGYVELFADGSLGSISEDQTFAVTVMQRAYERLEQLVNDLLRFSKASQGEFTLRVEPISISDILHKAVQITSPKAQARTINLKADTSPNLPLVRGDEEKITWVIAQLLDNAIKFTEPGGKVELWTSTDDKGVTIYVRDTGIGISPENLAEIFEPFHQLNGSSTRRYGGTGLGLALVLRILEGHGALPKVQSEEGVGTSIEFILPIAKE
jgi:signal transduction histidine kinase